MNPGERSQLIDDLLEGVISEADFLRLEAELTIDPAAREEYYHRVALSAALQTEASAAAESGHKIVAMPAPRRLRMIAFAAMAAVLAVSLVVIGMLLTRRDPKDVARDPVEQKAAGFAVLAGQSDTVWKNTPPLADGTLLPSGPMHLESGVAQIELFSGVTIIVEGDAEFEILSPMEMTVARGKVRAQVPEPAHGFRIRTGEGEVVDLGTEFALNVSSAHSEVHVLDGKVEWHPRAEAMRAVEKGEALRWGADGRGASFAASAASFVGMAEMGEKLAAGRNTRREAWRRYSDKMKADPRLAVHFRMATSDDWSRQLVNEAGTTASGGIAGAIVAAARAPDRWGTPGGALDFSPAGSRVRIHVPGEHRSLTLLCWVRINSLDRWYNSLFLTDGAKVTQPHWQIMDDGRLFFSVKKRDVRDAKKGGKDKHHFMSPPIWNASLGGQWLMIATTYDVDARKVTHFLNGKVLSEETIPDEYLVEKVTIGAASLCNWSEPVYRTDAHFAVRNLNGSMDEFALFSAALTPQEIEDAYENGKP